MTGSGGSAFAPRWPVRNLDEVVSTQSAASELAAAGERGPLWVMARRQTGGRGRSGRTWTAPEGNLSATLLLAPGAPLPAMTGLTFVAGVAVHEALAGLLPQGVPLRLKWPNDVLVGRAKVAGILIETARFGADLVVLAGIGVNIAAAPEGMGREVTALADHGARGLAPATVLEAISTRLRHWLSVWQQGAGFPAVRTAWRERAGPSGERVSVRSGDRTITGSIIDLDADGALIVLDDAGMRVRVQFGDVLLA